MTEAIQIITKDEALGLPPTDLQTDSYYETLPVSNEPLPDFSAYSSAAYMASLPSHVSVGVIARLAEQEQPGFSAVANYEDAPCEAAIEWQDMAEQPAHIRKVMGGLAAGAFRALLVKRSTED